MTTSTDNKTKNAQEKKPLHLVKDFSGKRIGLFHYIAMFLWLGWFLFYITLPVILYALYRYSTTALTVLLAIIVTSAMYPIKWKLQPKIGFALGRWVVAHAAEYFQLKVYAEDYDSVLAAKPAIFGLEPHDILPVSIIALGDHLKTIPGHKLRGGLTSACFQVPGMRHIYTWATAVSVDKKSLKTLVKKGYSMCVCPGGAHEVTYMTSNEDPETVLYLKNRYGLFKIAAEQPEGLSLVPCYCFNQRPAFDFYVPRWKLLHTLGRKLGFIPLLFSGAFGIPFAPPKSVPMVFVMGKPIHVPHMTADDLERDAKLKVLIGQFCDNMQSIFDTYGPEFDPRFAAAKDESEKPRLRII